MRDQIFISYSHKDAQWLTRLRTMLSPLTRSRRLNVWADTAIRTGDRWRVEIQEALASAKVAVLLVSPDFLESDFVVTEELPQLLKAAEDGGLTIVWIPVRDCLYDVTAIADYHAAHDPRQPLASLTDAAADRALVEISKRIQEAASESAPVPRQPPPPRGPIPRQAPAYEPPGQGGEEPGAAPEPTMQEILPGNWQVQIKSPLAGVMGFMQLQVFPNGMFHGELSGPTGMSVVEGQWQVDPFVKQIGLQGQQGNGFQVIPYIVLIQLSYVDAQQLSGMTSVGEQINFQRIGPPPMPFR